MEVDSQELLFKSPSIITLVGATSSGKTTFVQKLLKNSLYMFTEDPKKVLYCYSCYQPIYDKIQLNNHLVSFYEGLPTEEDIRQFASTKDHKIVVLDDLMSKVTTSPVILDLFCQFSHHLNISVLFLTQNIFHSGKCSRSLNLNSHYYILFKNKRDVNQIKTLGRQLFPGRADILLESYLDATKKPYGYLLLDLHPRSSEKFMLRSGLFPEDSDMILYQNKGL
jgi:hypothetical protein